MISQVCVQANRTTLIQKLIAIFLLTYFIIIVNINISLSKKKKKDCAL